MQVNSSHFTWDSILNPKKKGIRPFAEVIEKANNHGLTDLVVPYLQTKIERIYLLIKELLKS